MININRIYELKDRYKNVLEVQKDLQAEKISMTFNEYQLKEIVYILGYIIGVMKEGDVTDI